MTFLRMKHDLSKLNLKPYNLEEALELINQLAEVIIELKKDNWELAVYPVEDHSFVEATSWRDEYKRIFKLFETNLK